MNRAGAVAQEFFQALQREQCAHRRDRCWVRAPHPRQACQKDGSGWAQVAQSGLVSVPPRISRMLPQTAQHARRFWQARHHGSPVILEISAGASLAQIEQTIVLAACSPGTTGRRGSGR